ncbi:conserved hypothetical protein [Clostridium carboxidivorans P7]|uniref:Uncharacterized protein n=1 Tax=Clostridium carboxidivorans P7 TaxID=536227 RepID=C6Q0K5_9CLOT|nr:hypothetical protein [Clostridium carboxidivorans]EET84975.1 conserved hypothetical protein [Clostridium carboxidivorans P7]EFG87665.1 hypothetical protein CLCAR_2675 [Clostridium carboxidivorans P7]
MRGELQHAKERAKQMMIKGMDWDEIRLETRLRQKDLKRIQKDITKRF